MFGLIYLFFLVFNADFSMILVKEAQNQHYANEPSSASPSVTAAAAVVAASAAVSIRQGLQETEEAGDLFSLLVC